MTTFAMIVVGIVLFGAGFAVAMTYCNYKLEEKLDEAWDHNRALVNDLNTLSEKTAERMVVK